MWDCEHCGTTNIAGSLDVCPHCQTLTTPEPAGVAAPAEAAEGEQHAPDTPPAPPQSATDSKKGW